MSGEIHSFEISRLSIYQIFIGVIAVFIGYWAEQYAPPSWPMGWAHAIVLQAGGAGCFADGIFRPTQPPSGIMMGAFAIAYALLLSVR